MNSMVAVAPDGKVCGTIKRVVSSVSEVSVAVELVTFTFSGKSKVLTLLPVVPHVPYNAPAAVAYVYVFVVGMPESDTFVMVQGNRSAAASKVTAVKACLKVSDCLGSSDAE